MNAEDVTGLILAGGRSRRFGEDKASYVVGGRTMLEHVYHAVRGVADQLYVSVRDSDAMLPIPVPVVVDRVVDSGPLGGLEAGLSAASTPWVLVVACDMPFVTEGVLRRLVDACGPDESAVVARSPDGRTQPLCACYNAEVLPVVRRALASGRLPIHELLKRLPRLTYVDVPAGALRNINAPADLAR
jgi:molybdopterin-guanine dinucleotide biosynthesis protein A